MVWRSAWAMVPDERAPSTARSHALASLVEHGFVPARRAVDDCLLVVSELVTNAVRAGSTVIDLTLAEQVGYLEVEVFDDAAGWPVVQSPSSTASHGRGLMLLDAVAARWGVRHAGAGKLIWAQVAL